MWRLRGPINLADSTKVTSCIGVILAAWQPSKCKYNGRMRRPRPSSTRRRRMARQITRRPAGTPTAPVWAQRRGTRRVGRVARTACSSPHGSTRRGPRRRRRRRSPRSAARWAARRPHDLRRHYAAAWISKTRKSLGRGYATPRRSRRSDVRGMPPSWCLMQLPTDSSRPIRTISTGNMTATLPMRSKAFSGSFISAEETACKPAVKHSRLQDFHQV